MSLPDTGSIENSPSAIIQDAKEKLARGYLRDFDISLSYLWRGAYTSKLYTHRYAKHLQSMRHLRDQWLHEFRVLPGAINSFIEITTSAEWMIVGPPKLSMEIRDQLIQSSFVDSMGIEHVGFEGLLNRMTFDWLTVGRCTALMRPELNRNLFSSNPLEGAWLTYLDPTFLEPYVNENEQVVWRYKGLFQQEPQNYSQSRVLKNDSIVFGNSGLFLSKVFYLLPTAILDHYLKEHLTSQVDGRKVRDIFIVWSAQMVDAFADAINASIGLNAGVPGEEHNIPVVSINDLGGTNQKIDDLFTRIGLSEIPEVLDLREFTNMYVSEIAGTLGMLPSYFWSGDNSSNRAGEQVQQERQSLQGPAFFRRSLARTFNNSDLFTTASGQRAYLQFEEEVDTLGQERRASTFKKTVETLDKLAGLLQKVANLESDGSTPLTPEAIITLLQRERMLHTDLLVDDMLTISENAQNDTTELDLGVDSNKNEMMGGGNGFGNNGNGAKSPIASSNGNGSSNGAARTLEPGQVAINSQGLVVDRRPHMQIRKEW